jgi:hypothetical protein
VRSHKDIIRYKNKNSEKCRIINYGGMKKTPRRKITVTSSLNEISMDQWENRVVLREDASLCPSSPPLSKHLRFYNELIHEIKMLKSRVRGQRKANSL